MVCVARSLAVMAGDKPRPALPDLAAKARRRGSGHDMAVTRTGCVRLWVWPTLGNCPEAAVQQLQRLWHDGFAQRPCPALSGVAR